MMRLFRSWPIWLALLSLPVLVLFLAQGIVSFYVTGVSTAAVVAAVCALLISMIAVIWMRLRKQGTTTRENVAVDMVDANPAWGAQQEKAWNDACLYIDELLEGNESLDLLLDHSLNVLRQVALVWNRSGEHLEYSATLPEALLAVETLAGRYRKVLIANVPFSNTVKLSQAMSLWGLYEKHETKIKYSYQAYRAYRVFSVPGLLSELGGLLTGHLSEYAQRNLYYNLKRAYLQEVANVAIDLYSGNFRSAIDELPFEQDHQKDLENLARQVGPIRIVIVGQISSGKSTLTNAILAEFKAESGLTPTTERDAVYQFTIAEGLDTHIIDTPGIEADTKSIDLALTRLKGADLVIWVMRANQPGRNIDQLLHEAFELYFNETPGRQKPAILLAATHIDCIPSFSGVTEETLLSVTAPLAEACAKAIRYDEFCPLALDGKELGMERLKACLAEYYERAINTRLNRIRVERPGFYKSAIDELSSLKSGAVKAIQLSLAKKQWP